MSHQDLINNYSNSIKRLKVQFQGLGLTEEEFKQLYFESLQEIENKHEAPVHNKMSFKSMCRISLLILLFGFVIFYYGKPMYSAIVCNLQEYVYPGLRLLRHIAIPFISLFPSLSELYDESCLIQNPFFSVVDMDCWPCSSVNNVRQITEPDSSTKFNNVPFVYETDQKPFKTVTLWNLYKKNNEIFDLHSSKVLKNSNSFITPSDMFQLLQEDSTEKASFIWKFNNMAPARLLRQLIPRPKVVPKFGQSTERFLVITTSQTAIKIPDTECNYSFLLLVKGNREIHLKPAEECRHQCKTLKVHLAESYLLWYNWWYWRPVVQPSYGNDTLIAHVGSYC